MNKRERQATIRELLVARPVSSQEELRRLLLQRGWDVTQSTLSRDLREMRVARVPDADGARYSVTDTAEDSSGPGLETLLPSLLTRVDGVGELVVLRTLPGGAQSVAAVLDSEKWPDVLGTIAGDDTILIVCRSTGARERLVRRLTAIAAG